MPGTGHPKVSVVVASHARPGWLARCLTSLGQLDYPAFEIVVAADAASIEALDPHPLRGAIRVVTVEGGNISVTRNAGIRASGGEWIAFLDDDAVAEPTWLTHYMDAAALLDVPALVGFVRGRNGISYQSAVASVDAEGETHTEHAGDGVAFVPSLKTGRALKLVGTNCLIRRDILLSVGGFDPAYRFFMDDTDLSIRLARAGHVAGVAPLAQVHHAFAPSGRRTRLRAPLDLTEVGRSTAIFAHRYRGAPPDEIKERLFQRERQRLVAHMVRGTCEPRDIAPRMATLEAGWREGAVLSPPYPEPIRAEGTFRRSACVALGHRVITARLFGRRAAILRAARIVAEGGRASVFSFSATSIRHRVRFLRPGIWVQTGGQFGRSLRSGPAFRWCSFADRVREEIRRVALLRGIGETAYFPDMATKGSRGIAAPRAAPEANSKHGTRGQL
ncbi:glycosyltransferase family 2 protein [Kangsaoukella pontilimi]|uniref:glycosyltransferase family 2 protein n=1 Tax=Kangsaoukella pontilimi TaxID=2691042 RepID=UPI001D09E8F1|nr:glycosyltransferase family 2 protein [Kangsaoukella pontilimi]